MLVNFLGGIANVNGQYTVDENKVDVKLDFNRSRFEGSGTTYMDDTYVFEITDDEKMTIDRGVYIVNEGDPFVRISEEPDRITVYDPDIVGKFVYTDNVYVKFFDGYECVICLGNDDTEKAWGNYSRIGDEVCVEIRYAPAIYGDNPSLYQEIEG